MTARYVTLRKAEAETGYTEKAMRVKIDRGVWLEGKQYVRAPDGHILIDLVGYNQWASGQNSPASKLDQAA